MMETFHAGSEDASTSAGRIPPPSHTETKINTILNEDNPMMMVNEAGNSHEDKPRTDTIPLIVMEDTDSECEGYHSSDFEFITESDAEKEGIIVRQKTTSSYNKARYSTKKRTKLTKETKSSINFKKAKSYGKKLLLCETDSSSKMATSVIQSFGRSLRNNADSHTESKMATGVISRNGYSSFIRSSYYCRTFKMATSSCENSSISHVDSPRDSKMAAPVPNYGTRSYYRGLRSQANRSIPEGQSYIELFLMMGRPSTGFIENKIVTPPACMSVDREIGFDMRTICRKERVTETPQLKQEARGSVQKILEIYPEQNNRRYY